MPLSEDKTEEKNETKQYITFYAKGQHFGVDIMQTREIVNLTDTTEIPNAPEFVAGVVDLRGEIVPIVSLSERMALTAEEEGSIQEDKDRIIIVSLKDKLIGLQVDRVEGIINLYTSNIKDAPELTQGINRSFVRGVGKLEDELIIILNLDSILTTEEIEKLKKSMDIQQ